MYFAMYFCIIRTVIAFEHALSIEYVDHMSYLVLMHSRLEKNVSVARSSPSHLASTLLCFHCLSVRDWHVWTIRQVYVNFVHLLFRSR